MAGRRPTAAQARDRRSKRIAIGLGLVLLVVGVVQGPKLLKQLSGSKPLSATPAPVTPGAASPGTTESPAASAVTTGTQLHSFLLLPMKDPFQAQMQGATGAGSAGSAGSAGAAGSTPAVAPATAAASAETVAKAAAAAAAAAKTSAAKSQTPTAKIPTVKFTVKPPNAALIKMNGRRQIVFVGTGFPSSAPLFKLVKLGKKDVRIGVFGGSFTSGIPTLMLKKGYKLTLANQSDGSRYVLELLRLTRATPKPAQPGTTPVSTPPAATPAANTPTTTTPATTTPATTTPATTTPTTTTPTPSG